MPKCLRTYACMHACMHKINKYNKKTFQTVLYYILYFLNPVSISCFSSSVGKFIADFFSLNSLLACFSKEFHPNVGILCCLHWKHFIAYITMFACKEIFHAAVLFSIQSLSRSLHNAQWWDLGWLREMLCFANWGEDWRQMGIWEMSLRTGIRSGELWSKSLLLSSYAHLPEHLLKVPGKDHPFEY